MRQGRSMIIRTRGVTWDESEPEVQRVGLGEPLLFVATPSPSAELAPGDEPSGFDRTLAKLTDVNVKRVRKTNETPPRVSVYDVISIMFEVKNPHDAWSALCRQHNESVWLTSTVKFPGRGQRETPVTDARGIVRIIMLLPCRTAGPIVRYLGVREAVNLARRVQVPSEALEKLSASVCHRRLSLPSTWEFEVSLRDNLF